jgi:hypothetical protein
MTTTWETLHHYLTRAEAHVAIGERFIAQHKTLMRELERGGRDIVRAWRLLETLEQLQALHVADRDRLVKQLDDASSGAKLAAAPEPIMKRDAPAPLWRSRRAAHRRTGRSR